MLNEDYAKTKMMEYNTMLDLNEKEIMFVSSIVMFSPMNRIRMVYLYV